MGKYRKNDIWKVCKKQLEKKFNNCTFWGYKCWYKWTPKKIFYPKNKDKRGEVCIICDRKFYLYEIYKEYRTNFKEIESEIIKNEEVYEKKEAGYNTMIKEFEQKKNWKEISEKEAELNVTSTMLDHYLEEISSSELLIRK